MRYLGGEHEKFVSSEEDVSLVSVLFLSFHVYEYFILSFRSTDLINEDRKSDSEICEEIQ